MKTIEQIIEEFWKMLENAQFVKSTDSVTDEVKEFPPAITADTEADCRAKMLVYLLGNHLITLEEINK